LSRSRSYRSWWSAASSEKSLRSWLHSRSRSFSSSPALVRRSRRSPHQYVPAPLVPGSRFEHRDHFLDGGLLLTLLAVDPGQSASGGTGIAHPFGDVLNDLLGLSESALANQEHGKPVRRVEKRLVELEAPPEAFFDLPLCREVAELVERISQQVPEIRAARILSDTVARDL